MGRRAVVKDPCLVCKVRNKRYANGCCHRCGPLVEAEGTHEKYGVPKETKARARQREKAAEYNRLIAQRMTQKQIAALWGMGARQLSSYTYRWRRSGLTVAHALGNQINIPGAKPKMANKTVLKVAQHGVSWGVTGCKCDLCKVSRNAKRAEVNRGYRKRRKERRQAAKRESGDS